MKKLFAAWLLFFSALALAQSSKYPAPTGSGSGTVTSITAGSGLSGGTITDAGTISLSSPVSVAHGGTNAITAGAALTNLGAAASATTISTTSPITGGGDLSANRTIAIPAATSLVDGYLSHTDWVTFNSKGSVSNVTGTAPVSVATGTTTPVVSMHVSDSTHDGYLSSANWTTFNGKAASGANADITSLASIGQSGIILNDAQTPTPSSVTILAPSTITSSYNLTLPTAACAQDNTALTMGTTGQVGCGTVLTGFDTIAARNTALASIGSKQIPALACDTNMALTGDGTCDGVLLSLATYPQVLLVNQTDPTENGIWCTAPTAWSRCGNMPDNTFTASGALVTVATGGGTTYDNTLWYINGIGDGTLHAYQVPVTARIARPYTNAGSCVVSSTTLSTTATNLTCTGVPASAAVAVTCSGEAAFSTSTAGGLYCRATGTADQIACNTAVANTTAMAFACSWVKP